MNIHIKRAFQWRIQDLTLGWGAYVFQRCVCVCVRWCTQQSEVFRCRTHQHIEVRTHTEVFFPLPRYVYLTKRVESLIGTTL